MLSTNYLPQYFLALGSKFRSVLKICSKGTIQLQLAGNKKLNAPNAQYDCINTIVINVYLTSWSIERASLLN